MRRMTNCLIAVMKMNVIDLKMMRMRTTMTRSKMTMRNKIKRIWLPVQVKLKEPL